MFIIAESCFPHGKTEKARHPTFAAAFFALKNNPACLFIEADEDHPGCADAYMTGGRIYVIEPEGFTLKETANAA